jgi:type VI protein secretion system component VasK
MTAKKLQEKKKKQREERSRASVLYRRKAKLAKDKLDKAARLKEKQLQPKLEPILSEEKKKVRLEQQLEHNMKILEALEAEYEKEKQGQTDLSDDLDAQGFESVEDKVKEVQRRIAADQNKMNILQGSGQANFGYNPDGGIGGPT